ncbi:uncharacterized protein LOC127290869 [Leptopilina boulardi]|uniref:uncharacterized protein LOC127290869 n=1 Tax=Leptopilina boulardi TaxID=63433 RepID=UPI0021F546E8|nr:uncharacterized protein LOC127290869 [Leptopilina boulardi]
METQDEKKVRHENNLSCKKKKFSTETEDEKKVRQEKNLACKNDNWNKKTAGVAIMSFKDFNESKVPQNYLGLINVECKFCNALHFLCERPSHRSYRYITEECPREEDIMISPECHKNIAA